MSSKHKHFRRNRFILIVMILLCLIALGFAGAFILDMEHLDYKAEVVLEAGEDLPQALDFLNVNEELESREIRYVSDIRSIDSKVPGTYPVTLSCRGKSVKASIVIRDTIAPTAQTQDLTLINPTEVAPQDFILSWTDVCEEVDFAFANQPDLTISGTQAVTVIMTDLGGNKGQVTAALTIVADQLAPEIQGVKNLETYVEDSIAYRSGITVTDDQDPAPLLEIDNSQVDLSTPGDYTVTYTATDHAGNVTTATANVKVYPKKDDHVDPETIYAAIDKILAKFIREDMTPRQKVEAVYCWVQMHTKYANHSEKDDWLQAAYKFYITRKGDCYSYFALNKLMLQRLGIPTIDVVKVKNFPEDTNHFWLMASIDGGETWYHVDNVWSMNLCLATDAQLDESSAKANNCFNRDRSLYPATPEEPLPYHALPWNDPVIRGATR